MGTIKVRKLEGAKCICILVHGLNNSLNALQTLSEELQSRLEAHLILVQLSGHEKSGTVAHTIKRGIWEEDLVQAYEHIEELQYEHLYEDRLPVYFLGYSLGALLQLQVQMKFSHLKVDKQILLAPACFLKTSLVHLDFLPQFIDKLPIPSLAPSYIKNTTFVPFQFYRFLFELVNEFEENTTTMPNTPTLLFCNPEDEAISIKKAHSLIEQRQLTNWKLEQVHAIGKVNGQKWQHLIIDHQTMGDAEWIRMMELMEKFLKSDSPT